MVFKQNSSGANSYIRNSGGIGDIGGGVVIDELKTSPYYDIIHECLESANNIWFGIKNPRDLCDRDDSNRDMTIKREMGYYDKPSETDILDDALEDNFHTLKKYGEGKIKQEKHVVRSNSIILGNIFYQLGIRTVVNKELVDLLDEKLKTNGGTYD